MDVSAKAPRRAGLPPSSASSPSKQRPTPDRAPRSAPAGSDAQHVELMTQREDLELLALTRAAKRNEQLEDPAKPSYSNKTRLIRLTDTRADQALEGW
jgi:hypothetical protein